MARSKGLATSRPPDRRLERSLANALSSTIVAASRPRAGRQADESQVLLCSGRTGDRRRCRRRRLEVTSARFLSGRRVVAAADANIPSEMAMKLLKEWNARGYGMDVILYKKARRTWIHTKRTRSSSRIFRIGFPLSCRATSGGTMVNTRTSTTSSRCTCSTT